MSTPINDGGPAFPCMVFSGDDHNSPEYSNGMTLRDWFAGQALAGLNASMSADGYPTENDADAYAECAYRQADAMLAERAKGGAR